MIHHFLLWILSDEQRLLKKRPNSNVWTSLWIHLNMERVMLIRKTETMCHNRIGHMYYFHICIIHLWTNLLWLLRWSVLNTCIHIGHIVVFLDSISSSKVVQSLSYILTNLDNFITLFQYSLSIQQQQEILHRPFLGSIFIDFYYLWRRWVGNIEYICIKRLKVEWTHLLQAK